MKAQLIIILGSIKFLNLHIIDLITYIYFWYHLGVYNEDFIDSDISRVSIFDNIFCFWYYLDVYIMQKSLYLSKFTLLSIWFTLALIKIITRIYKDFLIFKYPSNISIWLVWQLWYSQIDSLIPNLTLMANIYAFTYTLVQTLVIIVNQHVQSINIDMNKFHYTNKYCSFTI